MLPIIRINGEVVDNIEARLSMSAEPIVQLVRELRDRMRQRIHFRAVDAAGRPWTGGRDFRVTGELADALEVDVRGLDDIAIRYSDAQRSDGETNAQVARRVFADERSPALQPSAEELAWFQRELIARVPELLLKQVVNSSQGAVGVPNRMVGNANCFVSNGVGR